MTTKNATLDKQQNQALAAIPDDLRRDAGQGTENIGPDDVKPPRILLCQSGSPYRKPDDAKQIPGLNELDIFNDLSGENYGRGPLRIVVLNVLKPRYIEFAPMDAGGGVLDFNVPADDPRAQFTTDEQGKRVKPAATMFREYLVWLPDQQELAVLSLKGSALKVAVQLNGKIKLPIKGEVLDPSLKGQIIMDPPAWARTFSLSSVMERKDSYAWGNYNLKLDGLTPADVRETCATLAKAYAGKRVLVDVDAADNPEVASADDVVPF